MKKRILLTASLALILGVAGMAQEKLFMGVNVESPVKNADGTVTFNLFAPDAMKVSVTGDFLPTKKIQTPRGDYDAPGVAELVKNEKGRSEEHTSELQSRQYLVCRLLLEQKYLFRRF